MDYIKLIDKFLSDKKHLVHENDSLNLDLFLSGDNSGWRFENIPAPTIQELEQLQSIVEQEYQQEVLKFEKIKRGQEAREVCTQVLDLISGYNQDRELTIEQITEMQILFTDAEKALRAGRPTYAKIFINSIQADGVLVTEEMKLLCLALLSNY